MSKLTARPNAWIRSLTFSCCNYTKTKPSILIELFKPPIIVPGQHDRFTFESLLLNIALIRNTKVKKQEQIAPAETTPKQDGASPTNQSNTGKENTELPTPSTSTSATDETKKKPKGWLQNVNVMIYFVVVIAVVTKCFWNSY